MGWLNQYILTARDLKVLEFDMKYMQEKMKFDIETSSPFSMGLKLKEEVEIINDSDKESLGVRGFMLDHLNEKARKKIIKGPRFAVCVFRKFRYSDRDNF